MYRDKRAWAITRPHFVPVKQYVGSTHYAGNMRENDVFAQSADVLARDAPDVGHGKCEMPWIPRGGGALHIPYILM